MRLLRPLLIHLALSALLIGGAFAQSRAVVVAACGTPPGTYTAGEQRPILQDVNGRLCLSAGSSGITIGTTAITGGADGRVLFNDGGVVGEDAGFTYVKATDVATLGALSLSNGSTSAVAIRFGGVAGDGLFSTGGALAYATGGSNYLLLNSAQLRVRSTQIIGWSSSTDPVAVGADVILARDAANTLAQRNGTNAQEFRFYDTYTDASNYRRISLGFTSTFGYFDLNGAGTGAAQNGWLFASAGTTYFSFGTATANGRWSILASGHLVATPDNTYDIGASGATRPRTGYFGTSLIVGGGGVLVDINNFRAVSTGAFFWNTRSQIRSPADGVVSITNLAQDDFSRLQFGGTTSSFPALKRSAAILVSRLADDSANAAFEALTVRATGFTVAGLPAAGTAGRQAYVTDQLSACVATGAAITGGGALVCPVFDNGVAWVGGYAYIPGLIEPANDNLPWEERLAA